MYLKLILGFVTASLLQAGIVMGAEAAGLSNLQAKMDPMQLLNHILAGQAAGFILLMLHAPQKNRVH